MHTLAEGREERDHDEREAVLFTSAVRALTKRGFTNLDFDIGGKKARRRHVVAHAPNGEKMVIWIKSSTHWRGMAEAVRFPWKKISVSPDGLSAVILACEAAAKRGATHLLAVAGNDQTGVLSFARLFSLAQLPDIVSKQAALTNSVFYRAHSAALILLAYSGELAEAAAAIKSVGEDILLSSPHAKIETDDQRTLRGRVGTVYRRDPKVRADIIRIANGHCECCGEEGFLTQSGQRYLETHHLVGVSERGPDKASNIVAVCPACHRKAHFAADRIEVERRMSEAIYRRGRCIAKFI
jgi:5-methylcytosine-specific restriction endonuclease McrA